MPKAISELVYWLPAKVASLPEGFTPSLTSVGALAPKGCSTVS